MTTWLTKKQAAKHVEQSPGVIQQAVNSGELQAYRAGIGNRDYRLKQDEVDAWMESRPFEPKVS